MSREGAGRTGPALDVIVVGGGIAGLCCAWALARRGHRVRLFERAERIPHGGGASGDHHRIIRRAYPAGGYGARIDEAYAGWDALFTDLGRSHLLARPAMVLCREPGDAADRLRDGLLRRGHPVETLAPDEAARRHPFLEPGTFRYAAVSPGAGLLMARRIAGDLVRWIAGRGVALRLGAEVIALDPRHGRVSLASGERHSADRVVVCAGGRLLALLPEEGRHVAAFGTAVAYLDPPARWRRAWSEAPILLDVGGEGGGFAVPRLPGLGVKVGATVRREPASDPDARPELGPGDLRRILSALEPLAAPDAYRLIGLRPCLYAVAPDERFHAAEHDRALVVSACSGHGYKFAPAVGLRAAAALEDGDAAAFRRWLRPA